ncbi:MAG: STAS domain-containing protein [Anaerolineales bacterium]|nr:STAS domain-containing protein [Anaerolineales bacterium]
MTDTLSITTSPAEGKANVTVFHLSGILDAAGEDTLCEYARQAFEGGAHFLLLDMQNLNHISSAGLRALHNIFKMCTPMEEIEAAREVDEPYKSPYFKLAGASPDVYYVLNLAGFLHNIPFYPTMKDALQSFD